MDVRYNTGSSPSSGVPASSIATIRAGIAEPSSPGDGIGFKVRSFINMTESMGDAVGNVSSPICHSRESQINAHVEQLSISPDSRDVVLASCVRLPSCLEGVTEQSRLAAEKVSSLLISKRISMSLGKRCCTFGLYII